MLFSFKTGKSHARLTTKQRPTAEPRVLTYTDIQCNTGVDKYFMRTKEFIREQGIVGTAIKGIGAVRGAVRAASRIKWTPEQKDRIKELWNQGYTVDDIARQLSKETGLAVTPKQIFTQSSILKLPKRGTGGQTFNKRLQAQGGYLPFRGKTFADILKLVSYNISSHGGGLGVAKSQRKEFLQWLDTQILPTPQGKRLFDRMVALDTKMLQANHIRLATTGSVVINRTKIPTGRNQTVYKWSEIDEVSTVTKEQLTALQDEYKQITYELGQLVRNNFRLRTRLGKLHGGFGFIPFDGRWPATTKLDTYENWRKAQQQFFPRFLEQMNQLEDDVNRLVSAKGINVGKANLSRRIEMLGNPPDLVGKLRELQTTFANIRIKAGADFTKLRLPAWQLAEHKVVKSFENLPVFKSGGWNIAHVGTTSSKIDIHFLLNNVVVGGAEVKKYWAAKFGSQVIRIGRDRTTGVVKIGKPRIPTALSDFGQKLLADKLDSKMLLNIEQQLKDIKTGTIFKIDLTGTIDVSKYVQDFYSKKDQGRATFLVVGDEIFRLADEIPEALRNFPGMNRMRGIEGMQGRIVLRSGIDSRRRIRHQIVIQGMPKQNINSVKLNDLQ